MLICLKKIIYKKAKENIAESFKNRHACISKNKKNPNNVYKENKEEQQNGRSFTALIGRHSKLLNS